MGLTVIGITRRSPHHSLIVTTLSPLERSSEPHRPSIHLFVCKKLHLMAKFRDFLSRVCLGSVVIRNEYIKWLLEWICWGNIKDQNHPSSQFSFPYRPITIYTYIHTYWQIRAVVSNSNYVMVAGCVWDGSASPQKRVKCSRLSL